MCDTDSMAIAKPAGMADTTFYDRTQAICRWFKSLNPYSADVEIFKIEDENRAIEGGKLTTNREPLFCYAVSAKRYTLGACAWATPIIIRNRVGLKPSPATGCRCAAVVHVPRRLGHGRCR